MTDEEGAFIYRDDGELVVDRRFDYVMPNWPGLGVHPVRTYAATSNGLWYLVSHRGARLVETIPKDSWAAIHLGDELWISRDPENGLVLIDEREQFESPSTIKMASHYREGRIFVDFGDGFGLFDRDGGRIGELSFDNAGYFSDGLARICLNGSWGFLDVNGVIQVPPVFLFAGPFSDGMAAVCKEGGKNYHITIDGQPAYGARFQEVGDFREDRATFRGRRTTGIGYIDGKGDVVRRSADTNLPSLTLPSPLLFRCAGTGEGTAESADRLIEPQYTFATAFVGNRAVVTRRDGTAALIDRDGECVSELGRGEAGQPFFGNLTYLRRGRTSVLICRSGGIVAGNSKLRNDER